MTERERRKLLARQIQLNDSESREHERKAIKAEDYDWGYDDGYREALAWVRYNLDLGEKP